MSDGYRNAMMDLEESCGRCPKHGNCFEDLRDCAHLHPPRESKEDRLLKQVSDLTHERDSRSRDLDNCFAELKHKNAILRERDAALMRVEIECNAAKKRAYESEARERKLVDALERTMLKYNESEAPQCNCCGKYVPGGFGHQGGCAAWKALCASRKAESESTLSGGTRPKKEATGMKDFRRLTDREAAATPPAFRDVLLAMARSVGDAPLLNAGGRQGEIK